MGCLGKPVLTTEHKSLVEDHNIFYYDTLLGLHNSYALQFKYLRGFFVSPIQLIIQSYIIMQGFHDQGGK